MAAMVSFLMFVRPALLQLMGSSEAAPVPLQVAAAEPLAKRPGRTEYQRGIVERGADGRATVRTTGPQGSGVLSSMVSANAIIVLDDAQADVQPGEMVSVLLLEAGGHDWHPFIHMPAGIAKMVNRKGINWDYYTEPEAQLDNRRLWWPRGKVLGGSSSINAMCYIRGDARDYDEWAHLAGDERWNWKEALSLALPFYFLASSCLFAASILALIIQQNTGPFYLGCVLLFTPIALLSLDACRKTGKWLWFFPLGIVYAVYIAARVSILAWKK